jgi:hypothetical protein
VQGCNKLAGKSFTALSMLTSSRSKLVAQVPITLMRSFACLPLRTKRLRSSGITSMGGALRLKNWVSRLPNNRGFISSSTIPVRTPPGTCRLRKLPP